MKAHDIGVVDHPRSTDGSAAVGGRPRLWRRGLRWLMVLVYLAAAWPLVIEPNRDRRFPQDLVTGIVVAGVLLAVVAAVALGISRWRSRRKPTLTLGRTGRSYRGAVTSVQVVLIAFLLVSLSAAGRQIRDQQHRSNLAASDASSGNSVDRDRGALAAWMTSLPAGQQDKALALHQLALLTKGLGGSEPEPAQSCV